MKQARERGLMIMGALAALSVVAVLLGVGLRGVAAQAGSAVAIVDFAFQPGALAVPVGTSVTWTNTGTAPHTVTADDGAFGSGELAPGASFSHPFAVAGTFAYHCAIHPDMTASITVTDAAAAPAEAPAAAPAETPAAAAAQTAAAAGTPAAAGEGERVARVPRTGSGAAALGQRGALALLAGLAAAILGATALVYRRP